MLHTISWGEFFTIIGMVYGLYYGWWLIRYYPTLRWSRKGKPAGNNGGRAAATAGTTEGITAKAAAEEVIQKPDQAVAATGQATQTTELPLPMPAVIRKPVFLPPMVMADLMNEVRQLMEHAPGQGMAEPELVAALQHLINREPYPKLQGTVYEARIVEHIVLELQRHGPIAVDAMTVKGWWT
jgi:hypothetical protein